MVNIRSNANSVIFCTLSKLDSSILDLLELVGLYEIIESFLKIFNKPLIR